MNMIAGPSRKCNNLAELSNDGGSDEEEADSTMEKCGDWVQWHRCD